MCRARAKRRRRAGTVFPASNSGNARHSPAAVAWGARAAGVHSEGDRRTSPAAEVTCVGGSAARVKPGRRVQAALTGSHGAWACAVAGTAPRVVAPPAWSVSAPDSLRHPVPSAVRPPLGASCAARWQLPALCVLGARLQTQDLCSDHSCHFEREPHTHSGGSAPASCRSACHRHLIGSGSWIGGRQGRGGHG